MTTRAPSIRKWRKTTWRGDRFPCGGYGHIDLYVCVTGRYEKEMVVWEEAQAAGEFASGAASKKKKSV